MRLVDDHCESRPNRILASSKLAGHTRSTVFTAFVIFGLQRYARYDDSGIVSFTANDFGFDDSLTYTGYPSSGSVALEGRFQISQYHDRHINFQAQSMRRERCFVVMMKALVIELILQLRIYGSIETVLEMHVSTKLIDANFVDLLNVDIGHRENGSLVEILIGRNAGSQVRIDGINEFLLRIRFR